MVRALLSVLLILGLLGPAHAEDHVLDEAAVIESLLSETPPGTERFTPEFLAAIPPAQITALIEDIRADIGPVEAVRAEGGAYVVETATHAMPVEIALDAEGRIAGLFFRPALERGLGLAEAAERLAALEGEVSYLVMREGEVLAEANADAPLAVGSAFKLGILALLAEAVASGEREWEDTATLEARHISLPTGILQTFPPGAPVTLHTAAALMISISDNTATDLLMDVVGREALADKLTIDFALSTREFFFLKGDAETREAFLAASPEEKLAIVEALADRPLPALGTELAPHDRGVEWYVPARRLCALMEEVADLDVMAINPGVARSADWARVAFKGGSETGVLNLTTQVTDAEGRQSCVVMTINADGPIPASAPASAYAALLAALKD